MKNILKKLLISVLTFEAKLALRKYRPIIVAVTGSVGKTSAKDAIYAAIAAKRTVRKSDKSFNSELGVPLTVLGCPNAWSSPTAWFYNVLRGARLIFTKRPYPEYLVLEVGADHPGDIRMLGTWLHPDVAVLTRMADVPVHVENFPGGPEEVLREKMELVKATKPGGTIVVNADDPKFIRETADASQRKITYGAKPGSDVFIQNVSLRYDESPLAMPVGQAITLVANGRTSEVVLSGFIGEHLAYPFAAAAAVSEALGLELLDWEPVLAHYEKPKGRMNILRGEKESRIIDDSYNSSPVAVSEALRTLDRITTKGRKIAVLADMKELGEFSQAEHERIGVQASQIVHTLVAVGEGGAHIARAAQKAGLAKDRIQIHADSTRAALSLENFVRAGDVILVKGSQSMRMERVAKSLLHPSLDPADVLVRQEKEWQAR